MPVSIARIDIPLVHFLSDKQVADMGTSADPPIPKFETQHPDDSGKRYEELFELRVIDLVHFALAHGFLDTLSPEQADAIRAQVRLPAPENKP